MKYSCLRCGLDFKQRCHLENHLNRKNVCEPILEPMSINEVKKHYGFNILENNSTQIANMSTQIAPLSTQTAPLSTQTAPKQHPTDFLDSTQIAPLGAVHSTQIAPLGADHKHICSFCGKSFTRNTGLTKHLKICNIKKNSSVETIELKAQIDILTKQHHEQISKLQNTIDNLVLEKTSNTTTNNNNCNNTTGSYNTDNSTHNTININNYGYENKDYITKDYLVKLLKAPFQAIPKLIEYTHFNKDHPENQNIKLPNKKQPYVKVLKGDKWVYADRKSTILDLIDEKHCELNDTPLLKHIEENFSDSLQNRFERFNERYLNDEKEFTNQLYKETELVMINNS